jgi:integral membrane protein
MLNGLLRFDTPTAQLRSVAFLEGLSYVLLLFVAMPLKYFAGMPLAVRIVGLVHGLLFIALAWLTWRAMKTRGKPMPWARRIAIASLIPFGTFALDSSLRADDEEYRRTRAPIG